MSTLSNLSAAVGEFFKKPGTFAKTRGHAAKVAVATYMGLAVFAVVCLTVIASPFIFIEGAIRGLLRGISNACVDTKDLWLKAVKAPAAYRALLARIYNK